MEQVPNEPSQAIKPTKQAPPKNVTSQQRATFLQAMMDNKPMTEQVQQIAKQMQGKPK